MYWKHVYMYIKHVQNTMLKSSWLMMMIDGTTPAPTDNMDRMWP